VSLRDKKFLGNYDRNGPNDLALDSGGRELKEKIRTALSRGEGQI